MKEVRISLLGGFQVYLEGQPVNAFESDKTRALLAYLAVESDRPHRREALAELLWPGLPEGAARRNLRHTLFRLREALCDRSSCAVLLTVDNQHVGLNPTGGMWLDVAAFVRLLEECHFHLHTGAACGECVARQRRAMELYRGDFLQGFSLPDNQAFTEWAVFKQEELHRLAVETLQALTSYYEQARDYEQVRHYAHRQIELEPWREEAHRHEMLALALTGQREAAMRQFEVCQRVLAEELDLDPSVATVNLYEAIRSGRIGPQAARPAPAYAERALVRLSDTVRTPQRFVAREEELARLRDEIDQALAGSGHMVFVTGQAGSGKSALVQEFARQATQLHPDLLVTCGRCTSLMGMGDPYEPFNEALRILSADMDAVLANGSLSSEHADRLLACLPITAQALVEVGPRLIDRMVPGAALLARYEASQPGGQQWMARLAAMVNLRSQSNDYPPDFSAEPYSAGPVVSAVPAQPQATQPDLYAEFTDVLRTVAKKQPLLVVLEDMQWAGKSAANMLFYVARHLAGSRVLVLVSYRAADSLPPSEGTVHPLDAVVQELEIQFGDIKVDLDRADGWQFIDDLLDSEPNKLGKEFRQTLYNHTRGQALFTVELLRGLQARGDLVKDEEGRWVCGPSIDWSRMPPRVVAAIAERISMLPLQSRALLEAAAVEGNVFTLEVLVMHAGIEESAAIRSLSDDLCRRHRLVEPVGMTRAGPGNLTLTRYRFSHELYRKYVYGQIEPLERARLHRDVGEALEGIFGANANDIAARLAYHFERAGSRTKAARYLLVVGNRAARVCAWEAAMASYARGINLLQSGVRGPEHSELESHLQLALADTMLGAAGWGGIERMQATTEARIEAADTGGDRLRAAVDHLVVSSAYNGDNQGLLESVEQPADLLEQYTPDRVTLAHFALGLSKLALGQFAASREQLEQVLAGSGQWTVGTGRPSAQSNTLAITCILLAQVLWALGYPEEAARYIEQAEEHAREGGDVLAQGLILSMAGYVSYLLRQDARQAQQRADALSLLIGDHGLHVLHPWAEILGGWAKVAQGDAASGLADIRRGVANWRDWGSRLGRPVQLMMLAESYFRAGEVEEALAQLEEAQQAMTSTGGRFLEAELHRMRGEMLRAQGCESSAEAEACFVRALDVARAQSARSWELRAALSLARLWSAQGRREQARDLLAGIYPGFTEGYTTADLMDAGALLDILSASLLVVPARPSPTATPHAEPDNALGSPHVRRT